uniref:hypothetical protein n=1 Tax=Xanthomonas sp. 0924 TaxID=2835534 RepID=UPI003F823AA8
MHIVVDWLGITTAMVAKDRLRHIIQQDRQSVPAHRWARQPGTRLCAFGWLRIGGTGKAGFKRKPIFRWEPRR